LPFDSGSSKKTRLMGLCDVWGWVTTYWAAADAAPSPNRLLNECNYPHSTETLRAYEGIDCVDFLYQSRPISPASLAGQFGFKEAGDFIVGVCFFSFSPRNIAIKSELTSHLLALVGHMRAHGRQCLYPVALCGAIPVRRISWFPFGYREKIS
jgi:hypothetical protein